MFAIGEARSAVLRGKVEMPKEYRLKKRAILGKWKDENTLYLSDSEKSLNFIAGKEGEIFSAKIDLEDRLQVTAEQEDKIVKITGCISTIELLFKDNKRKSH